jgi:hypothetical protein
MVSPAGVVPLLPEKGTPLIIFEMLHQMKQKHVQKGGLKTALFEKIENPETLIILAGKKKQWLNAHPGRVPSPEDLGAMITDSKMIGTLTSVLTQSGHRIRAIRQVGAAGDRYLATVLGHYDDYPEFSKRWRELMDHYGLTPHDVIDYGVDFEVDLEPL